MPISASAKKSLRVAVRRAQENKITRSRLKRQVKRTTIENLGQLYALADKAAKKHVIHPSKAARLKSRWAKKVSEAAGAEVKPTAKTTATKRAAQPRKRKPKS